MIICGHSTRQMQFKHIPNYFNDSPIESPDNDRYGISAFAEAIANSVLNIEKPVGTAIALNGPWGSGKSSAVNLIRAALRAKPDSKLVITDFKCWWFRGEEALALTFLQNLHAVLRNSVGDKVKDLIPGMTQQLLEGGPVMGQVVSLATGHAWAVPLISGASKFATKFFGRSDTLEKTFQKLAKILEEQDRRFLIIIDDIDRLSAEEALAIFRLVKSVGHLPNVMYLLVFDRGLAESVVQQKYPSEGPHFLEKIIQAGFEVPAPLQTDLNGATLASISEICGPPNEVQIVQVMNNFYDVVVPYMATPRHVVRFRNAISVTWPAIGNEVNLADFLAMEALRLYEPGLFNTIRKHKNELCGIQRSRDSDQHEAARLSDLLQDVPESRRGTAKLALERLFPRRGRIIYGADSLSRWDAARHICVSAHFDSYFRLSLSDDTLPIRQIEELIERADDVNFVQITLREAALTIRKGHGSMVPVYLDELTTHARRVEKHKIAPFLKSLFEIHDEIDLEKDADKGFAGMANTTLRYHWLIRGLTRDRFSLEERTALYLSAIESASLGWLVNFVSSARNDYRKLSSRPSREEDYLVAESAVGPITIRALDAIRMAAQDGALLNHRDVINILYRWQDFLDGDATEVRKWTDGLISNDCNLVLLARAMTGQSWSTGMGGFGSLGDRVAKASATAMINDDCDILDPKAFRASLERIRDEAAMDPESLETVRTFLGAWDAQSKAQP